MKHVKKTLIHICNNLSDVKSVGVRRKMLIVRDNIAFSLTDEVVDLFNEIVKYTLNANNISLKFSEKYIRGRIESVLSSILNTEISEENAESLYNDLLSELNAFSDEYEVFIPIVGIEMEMDELSFGKISLLKGTAKVHTKISDEISAVIDVSEHTEDEKQNINRLQGELLARLNGMTLSKFVVVAEPIRAKERALEETRRIIDVLRFSIPAIYPDSDKVDISIFGESSSEARPIPIISTDGKRYTIQTDRIGPFRKYNLNSNTFERLEQIGAVRLFDKLKRDLNSMSDFERTLLKSIHWFSSHSIQPEMENKLLALLISLESLLTPRDGNPIGNAIAEGVAILLGKEVESRKLIKKRVKKLYGIRSGVSHGGNKAVLETDFHELRAIVGSVIMKIITIMDHYKSQKELLEWIEDQKLS